MRDIPFKPSQGYLYLRMIKTPFGETTESGLILATQTPSQWFYVAVVPEDRTIDGRVITPMYRAGDAVLIPASAPEVVHVGNGDTMGLVHESVAKSYIRAGGFTPEFIDRTADTIMKEANARKAKAERESNGEGLVVPMNGVAGHIGGNRFVTG